MFTHIDPSKNAQRGFTLIEMAISTIIVGLLLASFTPIYFQKKEKERFDETRSDVTVVSSALGDFRSLYGHYACPARTDVSRDNPAYGREGDCTDTSVAPGACVNGQCVQNSVRTITDPATGATITPRVRVGMIPFRDLGLSENMAFDKYGSPLTYAVTERQANPNIQFSETEGGVDVFGDTNTSALSPAGSAHFIVISHGKNRSGAFIPGSTTNERVPCPANGAERRNCSADLLAVYQAKERSTNESDDSAFDDAVSYFDQGQMNYWKVRDPDSSANPNAVPPIQQIDNTKNVVFNGGDTTVTEPATDIVEGRLRAADSLETQNLCENGGSDDCFPTSKIAGPTGIRCTNPNEFMVGIQDGEAICRTVIVSSCGDNEKIVGVNSDGSLNCESLPLRCPTAAVNNCGSVQTLSAADEGTIQTITAGTSFSQRYICRNGSWARRGSATGSCTCTPTTETRTRTPLQNGGCGAGFTGNVFQERTMTCPAGTWSGWVAVRNTCVCNPTTETQNLDCPSNQTGTIVQSRSNTCPAGTWGAWAEVSRTCTCVAGTEQTRSVSCPSGYDGYINERRTLQCPAGTWSDWAETTRTCRCTPTSETREIECDAGYVGTITQSRSFTCGAVGSWSDWAETANTCTPAPPVFCKWNNTTSGSGGTSPNSSNEKGERCDCGSAPAPCYVRAGSGSYILYPSCTCN